ncbi:MAG: hypothetical protein WCL18_10225 [bacterium]
MYYFYHQNLMELFQVLHKNIPQKNKVFALFSNQQQQQDISKFLLQTIKSMKKEIKDIKMINAFCIELHDILYYSIMFHKIKVAKNILRLLEILALPIRYHGTQKCDEALKKICKIKIS